MSAGPLEALGRRAARAARGLTAAGGRALAAAAAAVAMLASSSVSSCIMSVNVLFFVAPSLPSVRSLSTYCQMLGGFA